MKTRRVNVLWIFVTFAHSCDLSHGQQLIRVSPETLARANEEMHPLERLNVEKNLRWMLDRSRGVERLDEAHVAIFVDAGVWHPGALSIVECLEKKGTRVRTLDRTRLNDQGLKGIHTLFLAGGWAPLQMLAAGEEGLSAIHEFVEAGGRCIGICAGAYLLSDIVKYEGQSYDYPMGLFPGTAEGPVEGLTHYPLPGSTQVITTELGKVWELDSLQDAKVYYSGGPFFRPTPTTEVLATYPNGTAAVIRHLIGKGDVLLLGIHLERPVPLEGDDSAPPPSIAGRIFDRWCKPRSIEE